MVLVDRLPGHSTAVIVYGLVLYLVHLEGSKLRVCIMHDFNKGSLFLVVQECD